MCFGYMRGSLHIPAMRFPRGSHFYLVVPCHLFSDQLQEFTQINVIDHHPHLITVTTFIAVINPSTFIYYYLHWRYHNLDHVKCPSSPEVYTSQLLPILSTSIRWTLSSIFSPSSTILCTFLK